MFFGLVPLLVTIGIVVLIARLVGGCNRTTGEGGVSARRVFQYLAMGVTLVLSCVGLAGLIDAALPSALQVTADTSAIARSISFLVVGGPAFVALALYTRRLLRDDPEEVRSAGWALYLTLVLFGSLVAAMFPLIVALGGLLVGDGVDGSTLVTVVIWGTVWATHWWVASRHGYAPNLRFERILGSFVGLATMLSTGAFAAAAVLMEVYDAVFDTPGVEPSADQIVRPLVACAIGAVVWVWYWLLNAIRDERTMLWNAYVLLAGVLSGVLMVAAGIGTAVFRVLEWFLADPSDAAADHFEVLAAAFGVVAVGAATWVYHRHVLAGADEHERTVVDRVYDYLLAGAGLAVTAGGMVTLVAYAILAISGTEITGPDRDVIVVALTLLVVGAPLWGIYWGRAQGERKHHESYEQQSTTRRIYLVVVFGVSGLIALVSLIVLVYSLVQAMLDGTIGATLLDGMAVPTALLVTTGAVAWYHFDVVRHDRAEAPVVVQTAVREVILVTADGEELASAMTEADIRVRTFHTAAPAVDAESVDEVLAALSAEAHEHIVVVERADGGFEVIPLN
jgi:hypothetical protein